MQGVSYHSSEEYEEFFNICVTDKLPLIDSYKESGFLVPSLLSVEKKMN